MRFIFFAPPLQTQCLKWNVGHFLIAARTCTLSRPHPRPRSQSTRLRVQHELSGAHSLSQRMAPADERGRTTIFAAVGDWGGYAEVQRMHSRTFR
jgi:hypothetical protein